MNKSAVTAFGVLLMAAALTCQAQENANEQVQSGEAGYKTGCSLANSMGIEACEEMPSYRAMELARQRIEEAQERAQQQAERDYHNSLLHRGPYYSIPATPYDACADCAPLR